MRQFAVFVRHDWFGGYERHSVYPTLDEAVNAMKFLKKTIYPPYEDIFVRGVEVEEARTVRHGLIYDKDNRIVGIA